MNILGEGRAYPRETPEPVHVVNIYNHLRNKSIFEESEERK